MSMTRTQRAATCLAVGALLVACLPAPSAGQLSASPTPNPSVQSAEAGPTALPTRTAFAPGQIFDYPAQSGDTLPGVAAHFHTTVDEVVAANPDLPDDLTTLPAGYPLKVPAYYAPLTGSPFHILPDSEVVNGPSVVDFDIRQEILSRPGFLSGLTDYAFGRQLNTAWEVVDVASRNYSINPRLLLALLEYQTHALTLPFAKDDDAIYPLGIRDPLQRGLYRQLIWAAERINEGYYGWRAGTLDSITLADGKMTRPDEWQNAGTVGVQMFFASLYGEAEFDRIIGPEGFFQTYLSLWDDPARREITLIPGNLRQPELSLPFLPNRIWDFTGGPHATWGESLPMGALDFAPPATEGGCADSGEWIAAPVGGIVTRSEEALVLLDLDGDGDDRTGWVLLFFHVADRDRVAVGKVLKRGDLIGHPSCEGGRATGTHFHFARRFNGEWIPAAGTLPFILDGWVAHYGELPYEGTLRRGSKVVEACTCTMQANRIIYELK
jgi:murein DD-endopeptidase MepM/ murein hydrolase activator NlpD